METESLSLPGGFIWSEEQFTNRKRKEYESSEDDDVADKEEQLKISQKKKKRKKHRESLVAEKKLREFEKKRQDPDYVPETALEYEELLQNTPNSYKNWVQYACFHLSNAELDKCKGVLKRALDGIDFENEKGRQKVWQMLLRIEVTFGTKKSAQELFADALVRNNDLKIYEIMADIYSDSEKIEEAENVIKIMIKKYSQKSDVWIRAATFHYVRGDTAKGEEIFKKSYLSLPKKDHLSVDNRAAQLEFKYGDPEKGKTLFEKILSDNPKRLDIWFVFSDLLMKNKDIEGARHVFDRMTGLNLKPNKMRSIFNKFQQFEIENGTPQSVDSVRRRVADYVNMMNNK